MLADVASVLAWGALWLMASHLADACEAADTTLCRALTGCFLGGFLLSLVDFVIEAGMATLLERLSWRALDRIRLARICPKGDDAPSTHLSAPARRTLTQARNAARQPRLRDGRDPTDHRVRCRADALV